MTYTAITFDNQKYPFDEKHLDAVKAAMNGGGTVRLAGGFVKGSDIRRIEEGSQTGEYGPHLHAEARDIFRLAEGSPASFWKDVFFENARRKGEGKPWYCASAIEWANSEGITDEASIFAFLDSEPEKAAGHNTPDPKLLDRKPDAWNRAESARFYATQEGQDYARKWRGK